MNKDQQNLPLSGRTIEAIEEAVGQKLENLIQSLREQGFSTSEIYDYLREKSGVSFARRQLQRWLNAVGIQHTRDEAGRKRWAQGLMDNVPAKIRRSLARSSIVGSKIEELIRWELKGELEQRKDYEVITDSRTGQSWGISKSTFQLSLSGDRINGSAG